MTTYVLVHGAWHASWCWHKVTLRLEAAGHRVLAPDLPGYGNDTTPANAITADLYVDSLCNLLMHVEQNVIMVGHSMGGMVISQTAERLPDRINRLVYVAAFLPGHGQSIRDLDSDMAGSLVAPNLVVSADKQCLTLPAHLLRAAFYEDCEETDIAYALPRLQPQPVRPFLAPVRLSAKRYGSIPRSYIECLRDRAIPVTGQRNMNRRDGCPDIQTLDTSHSPFFSAPDALAGILLRL